ncbi:nuclear transport factor 2 family protein [Pseudoalteromonas luteoviolacea]|uniref:SnoaL-like domain-containing protein n=1 Tax=Pseudoalteromonas luteoviolacea H33 TaxID=1365251 RepID=A0A167F7A9_9GAMM|nr:nuclear transport factor 2 family protein [Pseudoalteromonas luteoviolacea]KZN51871.1 hypothetical protein N476_00685 [Pseudoalteromonas luteoviolacea H33]KZN78587.1 hypothetical protein N477_07160 [Pseudoalteromonas luteoviolacea H33-S]
MFARIVFLILLLQLSGCVSTTTELNHSRLTKLTEDYIKAYQARSDFQYFLSLYAESVVLEDMMYGHKVQNKRQLASFFNWDKEPIRVLDSKKTISIEQTIISVEEQTVVLRGQFNPFVYGGESLGPWRFTTVLRFNQQGLINYQQDWINYFPRSFVTNASNLNMPKIR